MQARWGWLVGIGMLFGMLHVVTGPDHLSAIATLSAGVHKREAFVLGVRWGLGHSSGLLLVAGLFLALGSSVVDLDKIGHIGDLIVAAVLILLGAYGVHFAVKAYKRAKTAGAVISEDPDQVVVIAEEAAVDLERDSPQRKYSSTLAATEVVPVAPSWNAKSPVHSSSAVTDVQAEAVAYSLQCVPLDRDAASDLSTSKLAETPAHEQSRKICGLLVGGPGMQKLLSFLVGVLHGVAGPGGVLAVLPAIQLNDWRQGLFYLMFFSISSTLTMGLAAGLYGAVTSMIAPTIKRRMYMQVASSTLCVAVGFMWLALGITGKIDEVFP